MPRCGSQNALSSGSSCIQKAVFNLIQPAFGLLPTAHP